MNAGWIRALSVGFLLSLVHSDVTTQTKAPIAKQIHSIRQVDFEPILMEGFRKEHKGATMERICEGTGKEEIDLADTVFGDLDGDGEDEAAVMAFSCLAGTSGPDLTGVYKLQPDGKVIELRIAGPSQERAYQGLDPKLVSLRLSRIRIKKQRYIETYTIWGSDKNQEREFIYRWDGHQLVLAGIKDSTAE